MKKNIQAEEVGKKKTKAGYYLIGIHIALSMCKALFKGSLT